MKTAARPKMTEGHAILILSLFIGALAAGVVAQQILAAGAQRDNPYPALDKVEEPSVAANVAAAIANSDSRTLARLVDTQTLQGLQRALRSPLDRPVADVRSVRFVGAAAKGDRVVAAYVMSGKDMGGADVIVGFVLDVEDGQIVGVND